MSFSKCVCGLSEAEDSDDTIEDHLLEMFVPEDGIGSDGQRHDEGMPNLTCFCGLAAVTPDELDRHFLVVFTQADSIGRDGRKHEKVG